MRLSLSECHHGTWAISVDDESGGTRLTGGKCCGQWHTVKTWPMTAQELRDAAKILTKYAESAIDAAKK